MVVAFQEKVRIRLAADVKEAWQTTCDVKRITQQAAIDALLRWFTQQDSLMQSLILGQIEEKDRGDIKEVSDSPFGSRTRLYIDGDNAALLSQMLNRAARVAAFLSPRAEKLLAE